MSRLQHVGTGHGTLIDGKPHHTICELERISAPSDRLRDVLATLLRPARATTFTAGSVMYREGDEIQSLFVVESGVVKLMRHLPNGRARIVRLHASGALLGLNGTLETEHEHTAVAIGEVRALHVPLSNVRRMRSDEPQMYSRLLEAWNSYLHEADIWITQFSTGSIRSRVARLISFLAMRPEDEVRRLGEVSLLTCEDMANILGVTPESVSRNVADFKRRGLLRPLEAQEENYECDLEGLKLLGLE